MRKVSHNALQAPEEIAALKAIHERTAKKKLPPVRLRVGDFIVVMSRVIENQRPRWMLARVDAAPYEGDVDVQLWEMSREEMPTSDASPHPVVVQLLERIARKQEELAESKEQAEKLSKELRKQRLAMSEQIKASDQSVFEAQEIINETRADVGNIPVKQWQELKTYRVAPQMVATVLRAVMLLLGEDEACTWPQMQKIIREINFKGRIMSYDSEALLSPERRVFIMRECVSRRSFQYDRAMKSSLAIVPIYYWVLAQLDCGEAFIQKYKLYKEKLKCQREMRIMLQEITHLADNIVDFQTLMGDMNEDIRRFYLQYAAAADSNVEVQGQVTGRYLSSFAGREGKLYLKPAFGAFHSTDCVVTILRSRVLCNLGPLGAEEMVLPPLPDQSIHQIDKALTRFVEAHDGEDSVQRRRREDAEAKRLEKNILEAPDESAAFEEPLPTPSEVDSPHHAPEPLTDLPPVSFTGEGWEACVKEKEAEVLHTFTSEAARALQTPSHNVVVSKFNVNNDGLEVRYEVHESPLSASEAADVVASYPFSHLWALYEDYRYTITSHAIGFEGDGWKDVVAKQYKELEHRFIECTTELLGVEKSDIMNVKFACGSLHGYFDVRHPNSMTAEEIDEKLSQCLFLPLWDLLPEESTAKVEEEVVNVKESSAPAPAAKEAFQSFAAAEAASPEPLKPSLPRLSASEQMAPTPPLVTEHEVAFEGEVWEEVLHYHDRLIREAAIADTLEAVKKMRIKTVSVRSMSYLNAFLEVRLQVEHGANQKTNQSDVQSALEACEFTRVWNLLLNSTAVPQLHSEEIVRRKWSSQLERRFIGDMWEQVIDECSSDEIQNAFKADIAEKLGINVDDIVVLDVRKGSLLIDYKIRTAEYDLGDREVVEKLKDDGSFPRINSLYQLHSQSRSRLETGTRKGTFLSTSKWFPGESWRALGSRYPTQVERAVLTDVAAGRGCTEAMVQLQSIEAVSADQSSGPGLRVWYAVPARDDAERDEEFQQSAACYSFFTMHALYSEQFPVSPQAVREVQSRKLFVGTKWREVLTERREQVSSAFCSDVSTVLKMPKEAISVSSIEADEASAVLRYRLSAVLPLSEKEIEEAIERYDYPLVWEEYFRPDSPSDVGDDVSGVLQRRFEGALWGGVLQSREREVHDAFKKGVSDATGASISDVEVISARVGSLIMDYKVYDSPLNDQDLDHRVQQYSFPELMSMLPRDSSVMPSSATWLERTFDGELWATTVQRDYRLLRSAFEEDTADCFCCDAQQIQEVQFGFVDNKLQAYFCVEVGAVSPSETPAELQLRLKGYGYPRVWALYPRELRKSKETAGTLNKSVHSIHFVGEVWGTISEQMPEKLKEAVLDDVSNCLEIPKLDVLEIKAVPAHQKSLDVQVHLQHMPSLTTVIIGKQLAEYAYPRVWGLYSYSKSSKSLVKKFAGPRWVEVSRLSKQGIQNAFRNDCSEMTSLPTSCVQVRNITSNPNGLEVSYSVLGGFFTDGEIEALAEKSPFVNVWAYYQSSDVMHRCKLTFPGERWETIFSKKESQEALDKAFHKDIAQCFLSPGTVQLHSITANSSRGGQLVIYFFTSATSDEYYEARRRMKKFYYPAIWTIYGRGAKGLAPALFASPEEKLVRSGDPSSFTLPGEHWGYTMEHRSKEVKEAIRQEAAEALRLKPSEILNIFCEADRNGLHTRLRVSYIPPGGVNLNVYPFDNVRRLYMVPTGRILGKFTFEGDWSKSVRAHNFDQAFRNAFSTDMSSLLMVDAVMDVEVLNVELQTGSNNLEVEYRVDQKSLARGNVQQLLSTYGFPRVWELFQLPKKGERTFTNTVMTKKLLRTFEGEHWGLVLHQNESGAFQAFIKGVSDALDIPESNVELIRLKVGSLLAYYRILNPRLGEEEIKRRVDAHPFPELMKLYRAESSRGTSTTTTTMSRSRGVTPSEAVATQSVLTVHDIYFFGKTWLGVIAHRRAELDAALRLSGSRAVGLPISNVQVEKIGMVDQQMKCTLQLYHSPDMSYAGVQSKMQSYGYEEVWALLNQPGGGVMLTSLHQLFPGDRWREVILQKTEAIRRAFVVDTANTLSCPTDAVEIQNQYIVPKGLQVDYVVHLSHESPNVLSEMAGKGYYPNVWALYPSGHTPMASSSRAAPISTSVRTLPTASVREDAEHTLRFPGGDWASVVQSNEGRLKQAIEEDCLEALAHKITFSQRPPIVYATATQLIARVMVDNKRNGFVERDRILQQYNFPRVWALYAPSPPKPTRIRGKIAPAYTPASPSYTNWMVKRFEGPDWDLVLNQRRVELEQNFKEDAAEALQMAPSQVEIQSMVLGSLSVTYRLHDTSIPETQAAQQLDQWPFRRVNALYAPRTPMPALSIPRSSSYRNSGVTPQARSYSQLHPPATQEPPVTRSQISREPVPLTPEEQRREDAANRAAAEAARAKAEAARIRDEANQVMRRSAEEQERARKAEEEAERRKEAAAKEAAEAVERMRRAEQAEREAAENAERLRQQRPPVPLECEEDEQELDQLSYLRRALAEARAQRDAYQNQMEGGR